MFRFAHISDLHISPMPEMSFTQLIGKRFLGYKSWHRKRKYIHKAEVLDNAIKSINSLKPDHICVTGDIVNIGAEEEFKLSLPFLEKMGDCNNVSIVPGNHDAYVRGSMKFIKQNWHKWMNSDDGHWGFPYLKMRGPVAFIGVSSAVPTLPFLASGKIGNEQMQKLDKLLGKLKGRNVFRVIMIHHPPYKGGASARKGLVDASEFREIIRKHGCDLILHGHNHKKSEAYIDGPDGKQSVKVLGCGSASSNSSNSKHMGHFYLIGVENDDNGWQVDIKNYIYSPEDQKYSLR